MNKFLKYVVITVVILGFFTILFLFIFIQTTPIDPNPVELEIQKIIIKEEDVAIEKIKDYTPPPTTSRIRNPEGQLVSHLLDIQSGPSPKGAIFTMDGKELWVTLLLNTSTGIRIFDPLTGKKLASINLDDGGGVEIIFSNDNTKAYVSQMETARIFEIDTNTKKILRIFNTNSTWTKIIELSQDGNTLYASNWVGDNVSEIDLKTGKLKRNIPTVDTPRGIYVTEDGKTLYVAGFENGEIQKINLENNERKIIYKTDGAMRHIVADEEKSVLYISNMSRKKIFKVSLKTDEVTKFADTDNKPNTIALSPDKKILFVSNRGANYSSTNYNIPGPEWGSVILFDTENGEMLDAIVGGNQPTALAISPDGTILAFSNFLDNIIEIYKVPPYEILKAGKGGRSDVYKTELKK